MKVIIIETNEERELHYYRPGIAEDMADELIGNGGAVGDYINPIPGSDSYSMSLEAYQWWEDYLEMAGRWECRLDALREQFGADAVADVISSLGLELGADYNQHEQEYQEMVQAVQDELGGEAEA